MGQGFCARWSYVRWKIKRVQQTRGNILNRIEIEAKKKKVIYIQFENVKY
jgi:hypothetical protein